MDILSIAVAKKLAEGTATSIVDSAEQAIQTANEAVDRANSAADTYDNLLAVVDESILPDLSEEVEQVAISKIEIIDLDNLDSKEKKIELTKNKKVNNYTINKNYTSLGDNEDGSITQKVITEEIESLKEELSALKILLGVENV